MLKRYQRWLTVAAAATLLTTGAGIAEAAVASSYDYGAHPTYLAPRYVKPTKKPHPHTTLSPSPTASPTLSPSPTVSPSPTTSPSPTASPTVSPSPTAPAVPNPIIGATVDQLPSGSAGADFDRYNSTFPAAGKLAAERIYEPTLPTVYGGRMATAHNAGRIVYFSTKPSPVTYATGSLDAQTRSWIASMPTTGPDIYLTIFHEPEDNIRDGQFTLAQWKATITRLGNNIAAVGNPRVKLFICLMGPWTFSTSSPYYTWDWTSGLPWSQISFIGADPYYDLFTDRNTSVIAGNFVNYARSVSKPVALMEYGSNTGNTVDARINYMKDAWTWCKNLGTQDPRSPCLALVYFNVNIFMNSGGHDWLLNGVWNGYTANSREANCHMEQSVESRGGVAATC